MNKLIYKKLSLDIILFFLLATLSITLIIWVIQGVNLLDIVSEQGHGIKVYFFYTLLNLPKIFSKLLVFTYFLTLFVVLNRYVENNEILVFWINGIKKITFINFIGKLSLIFVVLQLMLNLYLVPYTQNLSQEYLKNSSIEFFPKLIQEKKFLNVTKNLTIFVENYKNNGILNGIYIKEKINDNENKIIIASKGELVKNSKGFSFQLIDGKIINIDSKGSLNIGFKETTYYISELNSKTRKQKKLDETGTSFLIQCIKIFFEERKNENLRCGDDSSFILLDIYQEIFKRFINPVYIVILSLICSLIILKPKNNFLQNYFKTFLFLSGFMIIIFSELGYKFLKLSNQIEIFMTILPICCILFFYLLINFKTKFRLSHL